MSFRELYDWYEYYNNEPFFADRIEIQLATLSLMVSSFGKSKAKHEDFMIRKKEKDFVGIHKNDTDKLKAMLLSVAKPVKK